MRQSSTAVIFAAVLVDMLGFGIVIPVLPFYAEELGASPLAVTVLIASYSAMQLVATPVWGRVSDRRGRRPLLIAGLFASSVSYLIFGMAETLTLLLVSRMAAGAAGGTISVAHAYVADTTTAEDRAHGMGLIGAAAGIGVMLGPAIGGFFSRFGLGAPGYVAAGLCLLNAIAAVFLLPESRTAEAAARSAEGEAATLRGWVATMTRKPLSLMLIIYFLAISSFSAMTALLALFLDRRFGLNAQDMGYVFALAGGATVVVRGVLLGKLVRRFGEKSVVRLGAAALAGSMVGMAVIPTVMWVGLMVPLWAFGAGTMFPALASLVSLATDSHSQGSVLGGSQVVGGLGRVIGPLWGGLLFQSWRFDSPFWIGAVLVAVAWVLAARIPARAARPTPVAATAGG